MGWTSYFEWQKNEGVTLLKQCGIRSGMNVLDFGCSIGEYTMPASIAVGEDGSVVSVDQNVRRIKTLRDLCANQKFQNIHAIKGTENSEEIHTISYDCVMYFDLYHAMGKAPLVRSAENQRIIQSITQTLKPNGLLLVSVFSEMCLIWDEKNGARTPKGFLKAQRVSIEEGIRWFHMVETIEECGFSFQSNVADAVHFDEFYKRGEPDMDQFERGNIYIFRKESIPLYEA